MIPEHRLTQAAAEAAKPYTATCEYDTGAMYDCAPACSAPATQRLVHQVACYGYFVVDLCGRHVSSMQGRVYPDRNTVAPIPARSGR